jgi:CheY-like chemotaxis protein
VVNRQVAQLTRMVDDLLDVSRVTQGRIELKKQAVALPAVIHAAIEAMEPMITERGHTLSVDTGQSLTVIGDAQRLQQCIVNLLVNAAKYTDPGGSITVSLAQCDGEAVIRVADSGVGIAADVLPAIFDLFVQSERTLDRAHGGLGIGLSVVKRLVEMHGGTVRAISDGMGQGATFEIRLALADAGAQADADVATQAAMPASQAGIAPQRVLVVDDNEDAAELLSLVLEAEGHAVKTAFSGSAALDLVREWTPDVVFLDIGLPEMNGYEVARLMRASPDLSAMRLVALTGYGQPADKQRAAEIGFSAHLVKPAAWEDIAQVLGGTR